MFPCTFGDSQSVFCLCSHLSCPRDEISCQPVHPAGLVGASRFPCPLPVVTHWCLLQLSLLSVILAIILQSDPNAPRETRRLGTDCDWPCVRQPSIRGKRYESLQQRQSSNMSQRRNISVLWFIWPYIFMITFILIYMALYVFFVSTIYSFFFYFLFCDSHP